MIDNSKNALFKPKKVSKCKLSLILKNNTAWYQSLNRVANPEGKVSLLF